MDLTSFWEQVFYPLKNIISIFFIVLITSLSGWLVNKFDYLRWFEVLRFRKKTVNEFISFLIRFFIAFLISFWIIFILVFIISIVFALFGFLLNYIFT